MQDKVELIINAPNLKELVGELRSSGAAQVIVHAPEHVWTELERLGAVDTLVEKVLSEFYVHHVFAFSPERAVALGEKNLRKLGFFAARSPISAHKTLIAIQNETAAVLPDDILVVMVRRVISDPWRAMWTLRDINAGVVERLPRDLIIALATSAMQGVCKSAKYGWTEESLFYKKVKDDVIKLLPQEALQVLLKNTLSKHASRFLFVINDEQVKSLDDETIGNLIDLATWRGSETARKVLMEAPKSIVDRLDGEVITSLVMTAINGEKNKEQALLSLPPTMLVRMGAGLVRAVLLINNKPHGKYHAWEIDNNVAYTLTKVVLIIVTDPQVTDEEIVALLAELPKEVINTKVVEALKQRARSDSYLDFMLDVLLRSGK